MMPPGSRIIRGARPVTRCRIFYRTYIGRIITHHVYHNEGPLKFGYRRSSILPPRSTFASKILKKLKSRFVPNVEPLYLRIGSSGISWHIVHAALLHIIEQQGIFGIGAATGEQHIRICSNGRSFQHLIIPVNIGTCSVAVVFQLGISYTGACI